jgi:UDP-D-galactose:(glucosyl)LPS alpha-1,6-D-galactosyltransferase
VRVFFVTETLSGRGGVETVLTTVSQAFVQSGHEVYVLLPTPSAHPAWEARLPRVVYYAMHQPQARSPLEHVATRAIGLASVGAYLPLPDVVVGVHVPHTALYGKLAYGHLADVPIVSWLHNPPVIFNDPHLIHYADVHWCISMGIAEMVQAITNGKGRTYYVGNPIDPNVRRVRLQHNPCHYLFIGRLENQQKRVDILLNGLAQLQSSWTLDVFGDGPDRETLVQLSYELGIHDRIHWWGWVEDPWDIIEQASALLLSWEFEGFPMVLLEAFSRGLPVIASNCPTGPGELVRHGINGLLFTPGSATDLYQSLVTYEQLTTVQREEMAEEALRTAQEFSVERVVHTMLESLGVLTRGNIRVN